MLRIDSRRVLGESESFRGPRPRGSDAEKEAIERLRAVWESSGWIVEPLESGATLGARGAAVLGWGFLSLVGGVAVFLALGRLFPTLPGWLRSALPAGVALVAGWRLLGSASGRIDATRSILARRASAEPPTARVVFRTPVTTQGPWARHWGWVVALAVLTAASCLLVVEAVAGGEVRAWWIGVLLLCLGLGLAVLLDSRPRPGWPRGGDNRSGLAFLAELGRWWPSRLPLRVEIWLVAEVGLGTSSWVGHGQEGMASRDVGALVFEVANVGVGGETSLRGRGIGFDLASSAVESLRLPFTVAGTRVGGAASFVAIQGSARDLPVDHRMLDAVAQLLAEVVLRLDRRGLPPGHPGASRARSSQNPG